MSVIVVSSNTSPCLLREKGKGEKEEGWVIGYIGLLICFYVFNL